MLFFPSLKLMHTNWRVPKKKSWIDLIKRGGTFICPFLILARVPTSSTGVFPERFLRWRGPNFGRSNPNRAVSPSMSHDTMRRNPSTNWIGSHLSNHMDNPKVDFPSISRGKICTFKPKNKQQKISIIWINSYMNSVCCTNPITNAMWKSTQLCYTFKFYWIMFCRHIGC